MCNYRIILVLLFSLQLIFLQGIAMAMEREVVALVVDVTGKATINQNGLVSLVPILTELARDTRIELELGATLVALYVNLNQEYELAGPSIVKFTQSQPKLLKGSGLKLRHRTDKRVRIDPMLVTQAAAVMRGTAAAELIVEKHPRIHWRAAELHSRYLLTLQDALGNLLHETMVEGDSYTTPDHLTFQSSQNYSWRVVEYPLREGGFATSGSFQVASELLMRQVEQHRPASSARVDELVIFALWLQQQQLSQEAKKYWKIAASMRPSDPQLADAAFEQ